MPSCSSNVLSRFNIIGLQQDTHSEIRLLPLGSIILLNINNIIYKIESFAHTEYNENEYKSLETIKHRIEKGIDPFDRFPLKYYEIDETYPVYVQNNYK